RHAGPGSPTLSPRCRPSGPPQPRDARCPRRNDTQSSSSNSQRPRLGKQRRVRRSRRRSSVVYVSRRRAVGNVPAEFSSFVGRRRELADVRRLSAAARLVTLTGVGGVGKSRLAVRVATQVRRAFPDGVWWVELAGLADPLLLPQVISDVLGIRDQSERDPVAVLTGFLAERRLLLVIDNCEHLVAAVAQLVTDLLSAASDLHVLATSRE